MPSGEHKFGTILKGATIGFLAVVVLLLVPIAGVRKKPQDLVHNWQELVLYLSCLASGAIAGSRLILIRGSIYENEDEEGSATTAMIAGSTTQANESSTTAALESRPEPELVSYEDAVEVSLAGEPKKRRLGPFVYYFHHDRERTLALCASLYLVLYVNCAVLCQRLHLGIIVAGDGDAIIRNAGVAITLIGLYLVLRGVMSVGRQTASVPATENASVAAIANASVPAIETKTESETKPDTLNESVAEGERQPKGRKQTVLSTEEKSPSQTGLDPHRPSPFRREGSRKVYASMVSHIPPTKFSFITRNFICLGSLLVLTGLPLVFHAWFPLVAIPGIFIVMSWMFSGENGKRGSLVVQSQQ